jgi:hypothetical protein
VNNSLTFYRKLNVKQYISEITHIFNTLKFWMNMRSLIYLCGFSLFHVMMWYNPPSSHHDLIVVSELMVWRRVYIPCFVILTTVVKQRMSGWCSIDGGACACRWKNCCLRVSIYWGWTHMRERLLVYQVSKSHLLNGMVSVEEHIYIQCYKLL